MGENTWAMRSQQRSPLALFSSYYLVALACQYWRRGKRRRTKRHENGARAKREAPSFMLPSQMPSSLILAVSGESIITFEVKGCHELVEHQGYGYSRSYGTLCLKQNFNEGICGRIN